MAPKLFSAASHWWRCAATSQESCARARSQVHQPEFGWQQQRPDSDPRSEMPTPVGQQIGVGAESRCQAETE